MGPSGRLAAFGSALTLAACAVIAGLDDPQVVDETTAGEGGTSSSGSVQDTGNGSSGGSSSGSSSGDAGIDAPIDATAPCTLAKAGESCSEAGACCSNQCNEEKKCVAQCKPQNEGCDPFSTSSCCVGLWCAFQCEPCKPAGQPAATEPIGGNPLAHSCCSRMQSGGQCQ